MGELDRIDDNLLRATGAFLATSKTGEVLDSRGLCITSTGLPVRDFNLAFPRRPAGGLEQALERAARYFGDLGLPYRVQLPASLAGPCRAILSGQGFGEAPPVPGMTLAPLAEPPPAPAGLRVRRVDDAASLTDFRTTAFEGFGLPVNAASIFLTEAFLALAGVACFVGYLGDEPACTASLVATGDVAGIYWVATRAPVRGRGLGAAITWEAVREGRRLGCALASLQASQMGRPIYARMGFAHDRDYARFDSPVTSASGPLDSQP